MSRAVSSVLREKNLYKLSASVGTITLGNRTLRTSTGGAAEWRYQLSELQSFGFGAQAAQLRYTETNTARDADLWGLSANYRQQITNAWQPVVSLGANYSRQRSTQNRDDLVPYTAGITAGVSFTPAAKWGVSLDALYFQSDYQGPDVFIGNGDARHDRYAAFTGGVSYLISRNLSIKGEAQFARNSSNGDIYVFPREVYTVKLRYEFK